MSVSDLPAEKPSDSYVQSFARGLSVIRAFNAERPAQTLSEVAEATGLTRAGARRILLTLVSLGYVSFEGRLFRLTPRILDLGFAYLTSMPFWNLAEPVMEELVQTVHESCSASVLDGTEIVYVLRVPTQKIIALNLSVGSRLPAFCTSMGRVLLSGLPEDRLDIVLRESDRRARTQRTITEVDALKDVIAGVRTQGWALVDQELEEGLISLSTPIRNRAGDIIAAMNISGQANRTSARQMTRQFLGPLQQAAERISSMVRVRT
ncbi:IclR family transcriptional regulator [Ralstonia pseudosolanacearum]|uniref:IclR family transcriptional regulator n=1 Tax=Ralstonia solanacearum TaxID=305 RepID=A0AA92K080_RALSL|nr:IclR family transcriptional regulator [Ralstonia pseudosolanacearum]QOK91164.1 IclR family transcriptional regulator [Ralstonia pseudosolanacearum]QOK96039.1 IclR family transcriptional regulator [Ralstonia pseudosolanacearum]UWD90091.1 IclR family transcriptional regulator [Ralstonia pseudosolanacearum]CAH0441295.1 Pca regulon regulatory protein [Ralstonia pseudosolanacearum]